MKKWLLLSGCLLTVSELSGQTFSASLTGTPVNTTGWTQSTVTSVAGNEIVLTDPVGNQAGYIYYDTPQNLSICSKFSVSFEFRISNSSFPTADGIAFWYITTPPSGFIAGGGIGLPNNPRGLVLIFDTYDNNSTPDNPLVALRVFNGTYNYAEGSPTGRLGSDLNNQSWITDGTWHKCELVYDNGMINVYLNGNTTPSIAAYYPLSQTGYFGFSASTGASWARHAIREVYIEGTPKPPLPVVSAPVVAYCQYDTAAPLSAAGSLNLNWYDSDTATTPLPAAPIPNTMTPGTTTWYVSQGGPGACEGPRDSIKVIVHPRPEPPQLVYKEAYCQGESPEPFNTGGAKACWYESEVGGTALTSAPVVNTSIPGTYTWYVSQMVNGCEGDRSPVTVTVYDGVHADYDYTAELGCSADFIHFTNTSEGARRYRWNFDDGKTSTEEHPVHQYLKQGVYQVKLVAHSKENCVDSVVKTIDTRHEVPALPLQVSPDVIIPYGSSVQLHVSGAKYYSWSPAGSLDRSDIDNPVASPLEPVVYTVVGIDEDGCRGVAQVRVDIDYTMNEMVPTAFTPNGDGRNDQFRLVNITYQKLITFVVYNRWGEEVFSTTDPTDGWDGTYNGVPQDIGTYYYMVRLTYPDGTAKTIRGNVLLAR
jgi:gliding motility-associated-like protein